MIEIRNSCEQDVGGGEVVGATHGMQGKASTLFARSLAREVRKKKQILLHLFIFICIRGGGLTNVICQSMAPISFRI